MSVSPSEVRLIPHQGDPYRWRFSREQEHLFGKHMSKQSKGVYMELCRDVGQTFEAVPPTDRSDTGHISLFDQIEQLRQENGKLSLSLQAAQSEMQASQGKCTDLEERYQDLQRKCQRLTGVIHQYRNITMRALQDSRKAFEELEPGASRTGIYLDSYLTQTPFTSYAVVSLAARPPRLRTVLSEFRKCCQESPKSCVLCS